jgi:6,7-dimethyl-8-ribityllumazine synthase
LIGVVASKFNEIITASLVEGCVGELEKEGLEYRVFWVPGTFEIPYLISKLYSQGTYNGFVAIGCIIKGETEHWKFLSSAVISSLAVFSMEKVIPITHAILTVENLEQALHRSGGKLGNKGKEAARALIELLRLP